MMNKTEKRNKKEEQKKMIVRAVCIALAAILCLTSLVSVLTLFA